MKHLTLYVFVLSASAVLGQDLLKPLLVTASRTEQSGFDSAYSSAYIDSNFIRENGRRTLPESLQLTPGVLVQKTAHGHGSPFIRGFTGRQNLLLFDGVRINNSTLRGGPVQYWNTVDPLSIDHIEFIKSQGSVLYGSDAVGGTLNAFSKVSDFRSRSAGESFTGGEASYEYRANGEGSHIGRFELDGGIGEKFGIRLGVSRKNYGDIEDSSVGRMRGTGYPEEAIDVRADWAVTADSTLTFATNYVNQDRISRWHRTTQNPGWNHGGHVAAKGLWSENTHNQERSLSYLRYAGENPEVGAFIQRWNATLSHQSVADSEYQNRNFQSDSIRNSHIALNTYGADISLESDAGKGTWVYGMDYYRDEVDSSGFNNNSTGTAYKEVLPVADDSSYDLLGAFGQYIWKPAEAWEITTGARYTYAKAALGRFFDSTNTAQFDQSDQWDALVGSLRAVYKIDDQWNVFSGISQAFRAPNLDDLTGNATSKAGSSSLGSTDVDPEKFITYEVGGRHSSETLSFAGSVFYTSISDLISSVPITSGSNAAITTNSAEGYIYGVELEGAWKFRPQWELTGFAAWQDGENESPEFLGGPIRQASPARLLPLTGSLALRWTSNDEKYWVQGRLLAAMTEDRTTAADQKADNQRIPTGGTPSYIMASVYAGWQMTEKISLNCGVENLTDQDYRIHGSGQNEPGLTGVFGARVTW